MHINSVPRVRCKIGQNKVGGLNARAHIKLNILYQMCQEHITKERVE